MPTHFRRLLDRACVELAAAVDELETDLHTFGEPIVPGLLNELVITADLVRVGERPAAELVAMQTLLDAALEREGLWADERQLAALFVARTEIRRWVELVQAQFEAVA